MGSLCNVDNQVNVSNKQDGDVFMDDIQTQTQNVFIDDIQTQTQNVFIDDFQNILFRFKYIQMGFLCLFKLDKFILNFFFK